jgi:hypothetical protein
MCCCLDQHRPATWRIRRTSSAKMIRLLETHWEVEGEANAWVAAVEAGSQEWELPRALSNQSSSAGGHVSRLVTPGLRQWWLGPLLSQTLSFGISCPATLPLVIDKAKASSTKAVQISDICRREEKGCTPGAGSSVGSLLGGTLKEMHLASSRGVACQRHRSLRGIPTVRFCLCVLYLARARGPRTSRTGILTWA